MLKRNGPSWLSVVKLSILPLAAAFALFASSAEAQWTLLDNFEGRTAGDLIEGTSGPGANWTGNAVLTNSAEVDPDNAGNLAMRVEGIPNANNGSLRGEFSSASTNIAAGATGTMYYRFRTAVAAAGTMDHVVGLIDDNTITNFNFKSGLRTNLAGGTNMDVRNGGGYEFLTTLADNTWYSAWMVSANTNPGTFELYLQSATDANFATQTQLATGTPATTFDYRINGDNPIIAAYFRNANNIDGVQGNDMYFDDVYINSTAADLSNPTAVPEPTGVAVLLTGMGVFFTRRRRR